MSHPYKTYSMQQFIEEENILKEKLKQAQSKNSKNHIAIYTRKIEVVRSFMLDADDFQPGNVFTLIEDPIHLFEIDEIKGVFAWGFKVEKETNKKSKEKEGFLLIMLGKKVK